MSTDSDTGDELLRARALLEVGRHDDAAALIARALAREPESFLGHCLMAVAEDGREDYPAMLKSADAAVVARPSGAWGHRLRSIALQHMYQPDAALAAALEAVRLDPHDYPGHITVANCHLMIDGSAAAQRAYIAARKAVELAPAEPDVYLTVGLAHAAAGDSPSAQAAYERVLALDPLNTAARNNLALEQLRMGRYTTAGRLLIDALALDPLHVRLQRNLTQAVTAWSLRRADLAAVLWLCGLLAGFFGVPLAVRLANGLLAGALVAGIVMAYRRLPSVARRLIRARPPRGEYGRVTAWVCTILPFASLVERAFTAGKHQQSVVTGLAVMAVFVTIFRAYNRAINGAERLQKLWSHRMFLRRVGRPEQPPTRLRGLFGFMPPTLVTRPVLASFVAIGIISAMVAHAQISQPNPTTPFKVGQCLTAGNLTTIVPTQIVACEDPLAVYRIAYLGALPSPGTADPCAQISTATQAMGLSPNENSVLCLTRVRHLPRLIG